jgi:hypothetical protein
MGLEAMYWRCRLLSELIMERSTGVAKCWCCAWIWVEAIEAVLTCCPRKPGESGDNNKTILSWLVLK